MTNPLAEPDRIAFAGDWHMNADWAEQAIAHAHDQGADVILHLGDFGYAFTASFLRRVSTALAHAQLSLLFVDGNHEAFPTLLRYPVQRNGLRHLTGGIWHLPRGFRWEWSGVRFLALGGAHSVDRPFRTPGASWWREETITAQQATRTIKGGRADVLISHDCPAGVTIPGIDDRTTPPPFPRAEIALAEEHRRLLRTVVDTVQPRVIWHGHYHQDYTRQVDLGYGPVQVTGLDCDGTTLDGNVRVVDVADLKGQVTS